MLNCPWSQMGGRLLRNATVRQQGVVVLEHLVPVSSDSAQSYVAGWTAQPLWSLPSLGSEVLSVIFLAF